MLETASSQHRPGNAMFAGLGHVFTIILVTLAREMDKLFQ